MGYGKGKKKGKQALYKEYEELSSTRSLTIVVIVAGVVVAVASLVLQALAQGGVLGGDMTSALSMGSFVGVALGAIMAALGAIKFIAISPDYKKVRERISNM